MTERSVMKRPLGRTVIEEANLFLVHSGLLAVPIFAPRVGLDTLHALIPKI